MRKQSLSTIRAAAGRKGGSVTSRAKVRAARNNGKRGGRPANPAIKRIMRERGVSRQRAHQILRGLQ